MSLIPQKVNHHVSSQLRKEAHEWYVPGRLSCLWFKLRPASLKSAPEAGDALSRM